MLRVYQLNETYDAALGTTIFFIHKYNCDNRRNFYIDVFFSGREDLRKPFIFLKLEPPLEIIIKKLFRDEDNHCSKEGK